MRGRLPFMIALLCLGAWIATPIGQEPQAPAGASGAVDDEILVKFRAQATPDRREAALAFVGAQRIKKFAAIDLDHVRLPRGRRAAEAIDDLLATGDVLSAQPNYRRRIAATAPPNDFFWINDVANGFYGVKKIQADLVWAAPHNTTGSSAVVIADIDTGVKYTHPDLAANMWINPGEIPGNSIDDDANGYVDDVHGINVITHSGNPMDDHGHGTHTAGTFGAVGNNGPDFLTGTATVGVNWTVRILACKFLDAAGNGNDAGAIECLNYITAMKNRGVNIRVSNNSWGSERGAAPFPQLLKDAFDAAGNAGILHVVAAGNGGANQIGDNIDTLPFDPASFTSPSIIAVAASDINDARASFSNFGVTSVDLAAPGVAILSTWIGTNYGCFGPTCGYNKVNGTSQATPHVAGAAALLLAKAPNIPVAALKSYLLNNVTPVTAWATRVATGGRLNVFNAANAVAANPLPSVALTGPAPGATFVAPAAVTVSANATDANGILRVEFYANTTLIGTDAISPFAITSIGLPAGGYALTATAIDTLGGTKTSTPVTITVTPTPTSAALSSSTVAFGKQRVGTTSLASQTVTITNSGPGALVFATFNGAAPSATFSVGSGNFQGQTNCPLTGPGLSVGAFCTFTFRFSPTAAGLLSATFSIGTNAINSPHVIALSGTGFLVDAATVSATIASGGARLQTLQQPDGGWFFRATDTQCGHGPGISCGNIIGVTGLAVLSAYARNNNPATLADAVQAGTRLIAVYNAAPTAQPFSQDLEFLIALSEVTADPQYAAIAELWFETITAVHPIAADRVDWAFARREAQGVRSLAVWDLASTIRSAKAVGALDYALAAATRIRELEPGWQNLNPSYTMLGRGSLLWAIHDLPGFDAQITEYRNYLVAQQSVDGTWDGGNLQTTAYVVLGLAAIGGPGSDAAIQSAAAFYIANQFASNGWPFAAGGSSEFSVVDAEVIRAVATLFSTQAGSGVQVAPAQISTVTFSSVDTAGTTTVVALDNTAGATVPFAYSLVSGLSYEVTTSAVVEGSITLCLAVPWAATHDEFSNLRILHAEQGAFVDRTILDGPSAPNEETRRICALVSGLDAFAVALHDPTAVDTAPPELGVTLSPSVLTHANNQFVTITATISVTDNADPSPAITLVSITSNDGRRDRNLDVRGAAIGTDDRTFRLRAERAEHGRDRIYTIVYRATDRSGNATESVSLVIVPSGSSRHLVPRALSPISDAW